MGCATPRAHIEENTIEAQSIKTGFEAHTADASVRVIRAHSTAKFILSAHFTAIKTELHLNSVKEDKVLLDAFYAKLSSSQESDRAQVLAAYSRLSQADMSKETMMIREEDLTVLAILLSKSSAQDKANALYDVFDDGLGGSLAKPAINELFKVAFELAISNLPLLTKNPSDDVKKYLAKAVQNFSKAIAAAVTLVAPNESAPAVTKKDFVKGIMKQNEGGLTSVAGLREFAWDQTKTESSNPASTGAVNQPAGAPAKPETAQV